MDSVSLDTSAPTATARNLTEEEQIRIEFYRSYDVMTGIRIAATLGGFFGLMVILVVYKSKSKTEKVLTDPKLAAAVVEAEEERQLNAAFEASIEYRCLNSRGARRSLGNTSAPCAPARYTRFSSVGDRDSLLRPTRTQHRFQLDVPSNITTTCSSSESSYLERRDSALALHPNTNPTPHCSARRRTSSPIPCYPIDIRVIQPTPGGSPCGSEYKLHATQTQLHATQTHLRLAPLASISSCASSLAVDYPDLDARSFGSDSVFLDDDECLDTDDEVTQFSTDSDSTDDAGTTVCSGAAVGRLVPMSDLYRPPPVPSSSFDVEEGSWSQETLF